MKRLLPLLLLCAACGKEKISLSVFREISLPVNTDLSAVWFTDALHGTMTGGKAWESGFLLSTNDGGESWTVDTSLLRKLEHVTFDSNGQGYACGQDMMLWRPVGTTHWQVLRVDFQWLRGAHFPSGNYGAVVSGEGYHGGQLRVFGPDVFWKQDTLHVVQGELEAVWYADSATLVGVGAGWVIRSGDAGQSWERQYLTDDFFSAVHFPDAHTGFLCGTSGSLVKTGDGGKTWEKLREGGVAGARKKSFRALWFTSPERGWLVGDNGVFWRTNDGGVSWQQVAEAPEDADFTDVFVLNGHGWATAKGGRFFVFEE